MAPDLLELKVNSLNSQTHLSKELNVFGANISDLVTKWEVFQEDT